MGLAIACHKPATSVCVVIFADLTYVSTSLGRGTGAIEPSRLSSRHTRPVISRNAQQRPAGQGESAPARPAGGPNTQHDIRTTWRQPTSTPATEIIRCGLPQCRSVTAARYWAEAGKSSASQDAEGIQPTAPLIQRRFSFCLLHFGFCILHFPSQPRDFPHLPGRPSAPTVRPCPGAVGTCLATGLHPPVRADPTSRTRPIASHYGAIQPDRWVGQRDGRQEHPTRRPRRNPLLLQHLGNPHKRTILLAQFLILYLGAGGACAMVFVTGYKSQMVYG